MKSYFLPIAYFAASVLLLVVSYPLSTYLAFSFPISITLGSYLLLAFIVTVVGGYGVPRVVRLTVEGAASHSRWVGAVMTGLITFIILVVLSYLFGPMRGGIPSTRVRGIFFAEWKFVYFIVYDATVLAVLSALAYLYDTRRASSSG